ncbi:MAG: phosphoglycerate mutase family protein [Clostridia bacterium]|nr:phosphoglycerate mutase family protein [Clostridia bacterium]
MKILLIRHADPYYPTDSLTEKGEREAKLLAEKLIKENITDIFVSPLGRAKLTAKPTADAFGIKPIVLDWLKEFPEMLGFEYNTDYYKNMKSPWNIPPEIWADDETVFDNEGWKNSKILSNSKITSYYDNVCDSFDRLIESFGYSKNGNYFEVKSNEYQDKTVALFCHFGIATALIAHILNMPLIPIWNSIFLPPSSVTSLYMEQHIKSRPLVHGIFAGIGDTSHLLAGNEPISCSGLHTKELK